MISEDKIAYEWSHNLITSLGIIFQKHIVICLHPEKKIESLEKILNHSLRIKEFLHNAIHYNYPLPDGWTRERLAKTYKIVESLGFQDANAVKQLIENNFPDYL